MTLVEVVVAIVILLVGLLGSVALIDHANSTSAQTKGREGGTNVGRAVIEVSRAVEYKDLTPDAVLAELSKRPGLADTSPAPGYTVKSRGFTYTVNVDVCAVDDPKDGLGSHDEGFPFCSDSQGGGTGTDRNPDDYRRVNVTMGWKAASVASSVHETSIVTNPVGGLGPSVTGLRMTDPEIPPTQSAVISSELPMARFAATTSSSAAQVNWSVNGDVQGKANGSGTDWDFSWDLAATKSDGSLRFPDCTYVVQAQGLDDKGRAGAPKALTVQLNRIRPVAPRQVEVGRPNPSTGAVDVQWLPNAECDVVGYRVYRGTSPTSMDTQVACSGAGAGQYVTGTTCLDEKAPPPSAGQTLYYQVAALDKDPSGNLRVGDRSLATPVLEGNTAPDAPTGLAACAGGAAGCNDGSGNPASEGTTVLSWDPSSDPDPGDSIYFYRIYRDGSTYADRYDVLFPVAGQPLVYVDPSPGGTAHSYRVSAVDLHLGESALSAEVTR